MCFLGTFNEQQQQQQKNVIHTYSCSLLSFCRRLATTYSSTGQPVRRPIQYSTHASLSHFLPTIRERIITTKSACNCWIHALNSSFVFCLPIVHSGHCAIDDAVLQDQLQQQKQQ